LGLIGYYKDYVKRYSCITIPLFDLIKKNNVFSWNLNYQNSFDLLKAALVSTPILVRPNFIKAFIPDVDWSTCKVGAILSQKDGRNELVIAYVSKRFSLVQKKFHRMEGECYALVY
jgi:hypothetical protein